MSQYIGQQLGAYRLAKLLGTGGFAEVYLGRHVQNDWEVAVKILKINYSEETFRQEANILWHLRHPHIVEIKEFNIENGISYLIMDYAARGSLRDVHPLGETLVQPQILTYVKQIADALSFMHNKQPKPLIHCDIKPQNFLMKADGHILLGDFGIATEAVTTSILLSLSATPKPIVGTIHYIAPEQWLGRDPTPATDQYALGVVVYEWLCGRRPFAGTNPHMMAQAHMYESPPSFNDPTISDELEEVVMRALEKDPKARYPSILDFAQALEKAINTRPIFASLPKSTQMAPQNPMGGGIWDMLNAQSSSQNPFTPPVSGGGHNDGTIAITPQPFSPSSQQSTDPLWSGSNPFNKRNKRRTRQLRRRRPPIFDWGNLQDTTNNNRVFFWFGSFFDLLCVIPLFLSLDDLESIFRLDSTIGYNLLIGLPILMIILRFLCRATIKPIVAIPFAWILATYETLGMFGLVMYLNNFSHIPLHILWILSFVIAVLFNDVLYARRK